MAKQELGPNQEKWLRELDATMKPQGRGSLCKDGKYCCLGIACEILGLCRFPVNDRGQNAFGNSTKTATAPDDAISELRLRGECGDHVGDGWALTTLNDAGTSFAEIAAIIREDPSAYFTEPR